tara:strand:- start:1 stop:246 length:246 start_codon:yes stop_codon:yes gene_type:complete
VFKILKRLNPFYRKHKRRNFANKLNSNASKRSNQISGLFADINRLESKIDRLIVLSGFEEVKGVIMDEHDAKKYQDQKYSH